MTDMEKGFNTGLLSAFGIKCRNLMGIAVFNETGTNLDRALLEINDGGKERKERNRNGYLKI